MKPLVSHLLILVIVGLASSTPVPPDSEPAPCTEQCALTDECVSLADMKSTRVPMACGICLFKECGFMNYDCMTARWSQCLELTILGNTFNPCNPMTEKMEACSACIKRVCPKYADAEDEDTDDEEEDE